MIASMPMKVCAKPEPGIVTNGELNPVAIAFASIVLPVPGAPRKSRPRSRFPPACSNTSPDCQSVTTRRISSFASAWPRTSSSLTPHSASPGSKPRICEMPISSIGPRRITKLAMNRKSDEDDLREHRRVRERRQEPLDHVDDVPHQVPPRISQTTVMTLPNTIANRAF